jgi:geranylgeranyl diphosphate synthase type II
MHSPRYFQEKIEQAIVALPLGTHPAELYEPIRYMLALGGKRLRPALLLMANEAFGGREEDAIGPALGIEVFHNFTLLHDDIMDKAPLRRSRETVHEKWNTDIAILSGDAMFVRACQLFCECPPQLLRATLDDFHQTALEVCEGQQLDMNFEQQAFVRIEDYLHMISLKTAVLIGSALRIGARIGGASETDARHLYEFGRSLGVAFQLHDDILDAYGDPEKFGKQVGGDIIANKKTYLLLTALDSADLYTLEELESWIRKKDFSPVEKVHAVKNIFEKLGVREKAETELSRHFDRALAELDSVPLSPDAKQPLRELAERLMVRES